MYKANKSSFNFQVLWQRFWNIKRRPLLADTQSIPQSSPQNHRMNLTNSGIVCIRVSILDWLAIIPLIISLIVTDAFQAIPLEQAARLPRNSSIIPGDPERRYAVELSVMHDLHCLVSNT